MIWNLVGAISNVISIEKIVGRNYKIPYSKISPLNFHGKSARQKVLNISLRTYISSN